MRHWCNHGDRGVHYTSIRYGQRLTDARIERSVDSKGNSYDNALAESLNALYKNEVSTWKAPGVTRRRSHSRHRNGLSDITMKGCTLMG
jgi:transposase InsO family protein